MRHAYLLILAPLDRRLQSLLPGRISERTSKAKGAFFFISPTLLAVGRKPQNKNKEIEEQKLGTVLYRRNKFSPISCYSLLRHSTSLPRLANRREPATAEGSWLICCLKFCSGYGMGTMLHVLLTALFRLPELCV